MDLVFRIAGMVLYRLLLCEVWSSVMSGSVMMRFGS
jgi:hypothetical protein